MNLGTALLGAAALYGVSRMARDTSMEDLRGYADELSGLSRKDMRKYGLKVTDDALLKAGLRRASAVPSPTGLVIGGAAGGLLLGALLASALTE
ncbi:MAG: hypothetical protein ACOCXM_05315 [Myxococcota bacterium]